MRIRETLEIAANLAIVLTCAFFISIFAISYSRTSGAQPSASPTARIIPYAIGDVVGTYPGLDFAAAEQTLVLVFRSDCRFCTESMSFYRRVADQTSASKTRPFVGITTDPVQTAQAYLASHSLTLAQVASATPSAVRVTGTPTLLLVDRSGKIRRIWRGRLAAPQESEVLAALGDTNAGL